MATNDENYKLMDELSSILGSDPNKNLLMANFAYQLSQGHGGTVKEYLDSMKNQDLSYLQQNLQSVSNNQEFQDLISTYASKNGISAQDFSAASLTNTKTVEGTDARIPTAQMPKTEGTSAPPAVNQNYAQANGYPSSLDGYKDPATTANNGTPGKDTVINLETKPQTVEQNYAQANGYPSSLDGYKPQESAPNYAQANGYPSSMDGYGAPTQYYNDPTPDYNIQEEKTAGFGQKQNGTKLQTSTPKYTYTGQTFDNVTTEERDGITYQVATETRDNPLSYGNDVYLTDEAGNVSRVKSQYNVGETVVMDGKRYKVSGFESGNADNSLNVQLKPEDGGDPVVMSYGEMKDKNAGVIISENAYDMHDAPYSSGDKLTIGGKEYTVDSIYDSNEFARRHDNEGSTTFKGDGYYAKVTDENGNVSYKSFDELDKTVTDNQKADRIAKYGYDAAEARKQQEYEAKGYNTINVDNNAVKEKNEVIYSGNLDGDQVYVKYDSEGKKIVISSKTGQVISDYDDSKLKINNIEAGDAHGFMADYEGREGVNITTSARSVGKNEQVIGDKLYSINTNQNAKAHSENFNNSTKFIKDGVVYSYDKTDGNNVVLKYEGPDGTVKTVSVDRYQLANDPTYKMASENKEYNVNLITSPAEKVKTSNFKPGTQYMKDGVVYNYDSYDAGKQEVTFKYTDANGNEQTKTVSLSELGQNQDYKLLSIDSETAPSAEKVVKYRDGAYEVSGIVVDDGSELREGGTAQAYDRPYEYDESMWGRHLTQRASLVGIDKATESNPLIYGCKQDAVDMLVSSGMYTRKDANALVDMYADQKLVKFERTTREDPTTTKVKYYDKYQEYHKQINGVPYVQKSQDLKDRVTDLQKKCDATLATMEKWAGEASRKAEEAIRTVQGRIKETMDNIYQALDPACYACEEMDHKLEELENQDKILEELYKKRDEALKALEEAKQAEESAQNHLNSFTTDAQKYQKKYKTVTDRDGKSHQEDDGYDTSKETEAYSSAKAALAQAQETVKLRQEEYDKAVEEVEKQIKLEEDLEDEIKDYIEKIENLEKNMNFLDSFVDEKGENHHKISSAAAIEQYVDDIVKDFTNYQKLPVITSLMDYKVGDIITLDDGYGSMYVVEYVGPDGIKIRRCDKNGKPLPGAKTLTITDPREISPSRGPEGRKLWTPPVTVTKPTSAGTPDVTTEAPAPDVTTQPKPQGTKPDPKPDPTTKAPGPDPKPDPTTTPDPKPQPDPQPEPQPEPQPDPTTTPDPTTKAPGVTDITLPSIPTVVNPTRSIPGIPEVTVPLPKVIEGGGDYSEYVPHTGLEAGIGTGRTGTVKNGNAGALGALAGVLAGAAGVGMTAMSKDKDEEEDEESSEGGQAQDDERAENPRNESLQNNINE